MPFSHPSDFETLDGRTVDINLNLAFLTMVIYDQVITVGMEVETIWTLRWRLPKFLFMTTRYVVTPILMLTGFSQAIYPLPVPFCNFMWNFKRWGDALPLITAEMILLIRVSALYGHSKSMLRLLVALFLCQVITVLTITGIYRLSFLPGCLFLKVDDRADGNPFWIPFVIFDGIMLVLMLYKVFDRRDNITPTTRLLARDSAVYFFIIFAFILANLSMGMLADSTISTDCVAAVAVSRMMMNMRGLAFDDPNCTWDVGLTALSFENVEETELSVQRTRRESDMGRV